MFKKELEILTELFEEQTYYTMEFIDAAADFVSMTLVTILTLFFFIPVRFYYYIKVWRCEHNGQKTNKFRDGRN